MHLSANKILKDIIVLVIGCPFTTAIKMMLLIIATRKEVSEMARGKYMYLLEKIKDGTDWPKGSCIWATHPCKGWRVVRKMEVM